MKSIFYIPSSWNNLSQIFIGVAFFNSAVTIQFYCFFPLRVMDYIMHFCELRSFSRRIAWFLVHTPISMFFLSGRKMILTCLTVILHHVSINDFGFLMHFLKCFWLNCSGASHTLHLQKRSTELHSILVTIDCLGLISLIDFVWCKHFLLPTVLRLVCICYCWNSRDFRENYYGRKLFREFRIDFLSNLYFIAGPN